MSYVMDSTMRVCDAAGCAAAYDALTGPADQTAEQHWLRYSTFGLDLCPDHTWLWDADQHRPALDHATATGACSCGLPLPGPTLGHMGRAWLAHTRPMSTDDLRDRIAEALHDSVDWCARCKVCDEQIDAAMAVVEPEIARLREERDLAVAHDRQPYPTQGAYDAACAALHTQRQRAETAEARIAAVREENARLRHYLSIAVRYEDPGTGAVVYPHGDAWMCAIPGTPTEEHDDMYDALDRAREIAGEEA